MSIKPPIISAFLPIALVNLFPINTPINEKAKVTIPIDNMAIFLGKLVAVKLSPTARESILVASDRSNKEEIVN